MLVSFLITTLGGASAEVKRPIVTFESFDWPSEPPKDCPFERSTELVGVRFTGLAGDYRLSSKPRLADTWYPTWAADGNLYSPYTDGRVARLDGASDLSISFPGKDATTGQAVLEGDDPLDLQVYSLGVTKGNALPYEGRYPCGSLVHDGVWYYGTYCLDPKPFTKYGDKTYNWPWLGPLVGFRISSDMGRTWKRTKHTPANPIFGENGRWGYPVKIGAPHFVDFGKNMEHSPDGKAYLVGHGATVHDPQPRFANLSWITGDQVYLLRVVPSVDSINDPSKYEFFAGYGNGGEPLWSGDFDEIEPLLEWNNRMGCVTVTYNAPLKKYLMCVTDGWPTVAKMDSYILEADAITGPWRLVVFMEDFGEQGYFLNFPSKFISPDGRTLWLCYSGNFTGSRPEYPLEENPPGSFYGLSLQQIELLKPND
jgi:hypothetical protein